MWRLFEVQICLSNLRDARRDYAGWPEVCQSEPQPFLLPRTRSPSGCNALMYGVLVGRWCSLLCHSLPLLQRPALLYHNWELLTNVQSQALANGLETTQLLQVPQTPQFVLEKISGLHESQDGQGGKRMRPQMSSFEFQFEFQFELRLDCKRLCKQLPIAGRCPGQCFSFPAQPRRRDSRWYVDRRLNPRWNWCTETLPTPTIVLDIAYSEQLNNHGA
jgi:hypothetical protein